MSLGKLISLGSRLDKFIQRIENSPAWAQMKEEEPDVVALFEEMKADYVHLNEAFHKIDLAKLEGALHDLIVIVKDAFKKE